MTVYYRLKQVKMTFKSIPSIIIEWRPQWSYAESGEWRFFSHPTHGWYAFRAPEEAEAFLEKRNPKWRTVYEGRYPLKEEKK